MPNDFTSAVNGVEDLEAKAGVRSLDALHAERRALIEANARLIALYGPFGAADDFRKRYLEAQKIRARMELQTSGGKTTEGQVDAHAYGSEAYGSFLDTALAEKVEWLRVDVRLTELAEMIRDRETLLRAWSAEAHLR